MAGLHGLDIDDCDSSIEDLREERAARLGEDGKSDVSVSTLQFVADLSDFSGESRKLTCSHLCLPGEI
jgi:hypothetical protein